MILLAFVVCGFTIIMHNTLKIVAFKSLGFTVHFKEAHKWEWWKHQIAQYKLWICKKVSLIWGFWIFVQNRWCAFCWVKTHFVELPSWSAIVSTAAWLMTETGFHFPCLKIIQEENITAILDGKNQHKWKVNQEIHQIMLEKRFKKSWTILRTKWKTLKQR